MREVWGVGLGSGGRAPFQAGAAAAAGSTGWDSRVHTHLGVGSVAGERAAGDSTATGARKPAAAAAEGSTSWESCLHTHLGVCSEGGECAAAAETGAAAREPSKTVATAHR